MWSNLWGLPWEGNQPRSQNWLSCQLVAAQMKHQAWNLLHAVFAHLRAKQALSLEIQWVISQNRLAFVVRPVLTATLSRLRIPHFLYRQPGSFLTATIPLLQTMLLLIAHSGLNYSWKKPMLTLHPSRMHQKLPRISLSLIHPQTWPSRSGGIFRLESRSVTPCKRFYILKLHQKGHRHQNQAHLWRVCRLMSLKSIRNTAQIDSGLRFLARI